MLVIEIPPSILLRCQVRHYTTSPHLFKLHIPGTSHKISLLPPTSPKPISTIQLSSSHLISPSADQLKIDPSLQPRRNVYFQGGGGGGGDGYGGGGGGGGGGDGGPVATPSYISHIDEGQWSLLLALEWIRNICDSAMLTEPLPDPMSIESPEDYTSDMSDMKWEQYDLRRYWDLFWTEVGPPALSRLPPAARRPPLGRAFPAANEAHYLRYYPSYLV